MVETEGRSVFVGSVNIVLYRPKRSIRLRAVRGAGPANDFSASRLRSTLLFHTFQHFLNLDSYPLATYFGPQSLLDA